MIAIHSQSMDIPQCPGGWEEMWIGYSYFMVKMYFSVTICVFFNVFECPQQSTVDNNGGFGQSLMSPGSCLEEFRAAPVIECHGHGHCNYYDQVSSFWLSIINEDEMFLKPRQQTLKADQTSKVSRYVLSIQSNIFEQRL